jgi:hypothetical protein
MRKAIKTLASFSFVASIVVAATRPALSLDLVHAFAFGSRNPNPPCPTANDPSTNYTVVLQVGGNPQSIAYAEARGYGYEVLYNPATAPGQDPMLPNAIHSARAGWEIYGPMDDSVNNRTTLPDDTCPTILYDSFIGAKNFLNQTGCNETACNGDRDAPCFECGLIPDGVIFRVDVPNGLYRFVGAIGSPDNPHASRILAENGGSGPPDLISQDHVVLVHNFNQADYPAATYARLGFGCLLPPAGNGPAFVNMDADGLATTEGPGSPILEVTEGYIRIHCLQGNASAGIAPGFRALDPNGGNLVLLEVWSVLNPDEGGSGDIVGLNRIFDANPRQPGVDVTVTLEARNVVVPTRIDETVPAGWQIQNAGGGTVNGSTITFNIAADSDLTYVLRPSAGCAQGSFSARIVPQAGCETTVASTLNCRPAGCGIQSTGTVTELLTIGPIDPGRNTSPTGVCDDGGRLATAQYFSDGITDETNVLVEEGDELAPDFGGAADAFGVKLAVNPLINPNGAAGILTVWRAVADVNGLVNFNLAENLGDPVDDYVIYNVVYLENTTGQCLNAVLEIGSDDAVKARLNGALIHVNAVCRGVPGLGSGDLVPVTLVPGVNVLLTMVVERGGGTGVRIAVRGVPAMPGQLGAPITDGRVTASCVPPAGYPPTVSAVRSIAPSPVRAGRTTTVTLTPSGVTAAATLADTFPMGAVVTQDGGGVVAANTITFNFMDNTPLSYTLMIPEPCPFSAGSFSGTLTHPGVCAAVVSGAFALGCLGSPCPSNPEAPPAELVGAFIFGSRMLECASFNDESVNYTVVFHGTPTDLQYDPARGWGYEVIYDPDVNPFPGGIRGGYEVFGPFDDSANNRGKFPDACPEQIYDSFIGAKTFTNACNAAVIGNPDDPCTTAGLAPEGVIFRVDVPVGSYRFVAAVGDADNVHAHRILAEDGGEGTPDLIGANHVVLVANFDQAQQGTGEADAANRGEGVYARVGFDEKVPPPGDGVVPSPVFVNMDANGRATMDCPASPTLEVTEGYIRIHQLQGNSNAGAGGPGDPNGGDMVVLELWRVETKEPEVLFRRGDADGNRNLELTDAVRILNFLFLGTGVLNCFEAADSDDNGTLELTDAIRILNFLFIGGAARPPESPGPFTCGPDRENSPRDLGCISYPNC